MNIGYRLSVFGFSACDNPSITGNFGFKDQWMALEWVKANIANFGGEWHSMWRTPISDHAYLSSGDANDIQVSGLSAGKNFTHAEQVHMMKKDW